MIHNRQLFNSRESWRMAAGEHKRQLAPMNQLMMERVMELRWAVDLPSIGKAA
jgi:hypothetical protein